MRKANVKNKYNLTPKDISNFKVLDYSRIHKPPFWRNDVIGAWCLSGSTAKSDADRRYGTYNSYWIGFYDRNAKSYAGKIRYECSSCGDMCSYKFKKFFDYSSIENEDDLEIQEKFLSVLNWLIDEGIVEVGK